MISARFDGLVCDMDGVVYRGDSPIAGAAGAIAALRRQGIQILFCTNNSRATVTDYVAKLAGLGIPVDPADVLTSAVVTAEVLAERGYAGKTAIVVGGNGIRSALAAVCISVKDDPGIVSADLVVVGWDPEFDYAAMTRASRAVRAGARLIATNDDSTFPASDGLIPGAGAILASIASASGTTAEIMGKPHAPMMDAAADRLAGRNRIAIVGDRPDTDLAGGRARGWHTVLVLSGVTSSDEAARLDPQPDAIVGSLAELVQ